jgi:hypothetical protein
MLNGVQVIEKNRFLPTWNRATVRGMDERARQNQRKSLVLLALAIALATLAPVVVLAAP